MATDLKPHPEVKADRRVPQVPPVSGDVNQQKEVPPHLRRSTGEDLLKFAGTWVGDDLEECLAIVYATRSRAKF